MKNYVYVGCRTTKERNARGKGISVYSINNDKWELIQVLDVGVNPSYQALDETKQYLYTIHGDSNYISAFKIDHESGKLIFLNTVSTEGFNPVNLSVDKTNRWIFVANLQTGNVVVVRRKDDGTLGEVTHSYIIPGKNEGTYSHPHQVQQDINRNFLIVSCQGREQGFGQIDVFHINHEDGTLLKTDVVPVADGVEPRHIVFHRNNRWCYGVNEKDYSVFHYEFNDKEGTLQYLSSIKTLPSGYSGKGWASGIAIDRNCNYIYVSNRAYDSITCFKIQSENGDLEWMDCQKIPGKQPRFICMTPENKLLVGNELSDSLMFYEYDENQHKLARLNIEIETPSPVCVTYYMENNK